MPDDGGWISRRNVALFVRPSGRSPQWPFSGPAAQMVRRATAPKNNGTDRNDPTISHKQYNTNRSQRSFRSYLNTRYGHDILTQFRRLDGEKLKFASVSEGLTFLCRCRDAHLRPVGLHLSDPCGSQQSRKIVLRASEDLLKERISYHHKVKKEFSVTIARIEEQLKSKVEMHDWIKIKKSSDRLAECKRRNIRDNQKKKFDNLRGKVDKKFCNLDRSRIVVNRSSRILSRTEEDLLARGLNYAVAPMKLPVKEIVTGLECAANFVDSASRSDFRSELALALRSANKPERNMTNSEHLAIKALRCDPNIVVLPADKGNATVVMDRKEYETKLESILADSSKFEKVRKSSPVSRIEKEIKALIKNVGIEKDVSIPEGCKVPHIYGLPKIHKPDVPLRPVVSCIATTLHPLAKYLLQILNPLQASIESNIKNTEAFISRIKTQKVQSKTKLVSFDVVNLFTSVPIDEALAVLKIRLDLDVGLKDRTELPAKDIVRLTEYCVRNTYFQYKDQYYKQVDGMAMGSPLSPVLCNIFMSELEVNAMSKSAKKPTIWLRYVDDTFVLWDHGDEALSEFLDHLNAENKAIKFTMEVEKDSRLAFLDTMIEKTTGGLRTSVYRKPTHTDSYLRWTSNHSNRTKVGIIECLTNRARKICNTKQDLKNELDHLEKAFAANGYPSRVIERAMKEKRTVNAATQNTEIVATAVIPYAGALHEKLRRICGKYKVRLAGRSEETLRKSLTLVAPVRKKENLKGAVYQVPTTCDKVYIGETGRQLKKRMSEHKTACKYLKGEGSAIAEHCITCGCAPQWEKVRSLGYEQNQMKRKIREAIEIKLAGNKNFAERSYEMGGEWDSAICKWLKRS